MHSCLVRIWSSKFPEAMLCAHRYSSTYSWKLSGWFYSGLNSSSAVGWEFGQVIAILCTEIPSMVVPKTFAVRIQYRASWLVYSCTGRKKKKGRACNGAKSNSAELLQHRLWWGRWEAVGEERERFCHLCPQLETPFSFASPVFSGIHESD